MNSNEFRMKCFIKEFTKYFGKPFHDAIDSDDREDKEDREDSGDIV